LFFKVLVSRSHLYLSVTKNLIFKSTTWECRRQVPVDVVSGTHGAPPLLTQMALASFIREGHLARHVRRMTRIYGRRRELLLEAMATHAGGLLQPVDSTAGLHVSALLPKSIDARRVVDAAAREELAALALHSVGRARASRNGIAFGLGLARDERIDAGMRLLASVLRSQA